MIRERCFKSLEAELKQLGKETITDEIEQFIDEQIKIISQVFNNNICCVSVVNFILTA